MAERKEPVILMGDFNDIPGSNVHQLLGRKERQDGFTHHGFTGIPQKGRIDWILASSRFAIRDAVIIQDHFNGRYPSDHFPYMVDLAFKPPD
ncbi:MAG: hypothetical protein B1H13_06920 [Desulfobacteraceae bacterium 4484_190.3]|nr:MAG: hypothetical protein B1H13_06920 [Desulfobacteraceae bacterium 4484_190.3]